MLTKEEVQAVTTTINKRFYFLESERLRFREHPKLLWREQRKARFIKAKTTA